MHRKPVYYGLLYFFIIYIDAFTSHSVVTRTRNLAARQELSQSTSTNETPAITERILALTQKEDIAIVIDVENVRGKTSFELDHCDLLDRLVIWTSLRQNAQGRTLCVVDHGSKSSAHLLHDTSCNATNPALCVSFAGPLVKADDIIARDVRWLLSSSSVQHVVVITADNELAYRCRSATRSTEHKQFNSILRKFVNDSDDNNSLRGGGRGKRGKGGRKKSRSARKKHSLQLHQEAEGDNEETDDEEMKLQNETNLTVEVIAPKRFLEDLEEALRQWLQIQEHSTRMDVTAAEEVVPVDDIPIPTPISTMQNLFRVCGEILSIESSLRKKCSLRKRQTLTEDLRALKTEWKELLLSLREGSTQNHRGSLSSALAWSLSSFTSQQDEVVQAEALLTTPLPSSSLISPWENLTADEQEKLLMRWGKRRGRHGTKREKTEDRIVLAERLRRQLELVERPNMCDEEEEPTLAQVYRDYINSAEDPT